MITLTADTLRDLLAAAAAGNIAQVRAVLAQNNLAEHDLLPGGPADGPQDLGRFQYGGQVAQAIRPGALAGLLCWSGAGGYSLRTNEEVMPDLSLGASSSEVESDRPVRDYAWRHSDAEIIVPADSDVCLYTLADGRRVLDHAPATLGLKRVSAEE